MNKDLIIQTIMKERCCSKDLATLILNSAQANSELSSLLIAIGYKEDE